MTKGENGVFLRRHCRAASYLIKGSERRAQRQKGKTKFSSEGIAEPPPTLWKGSERRAQRRRGKRSFPPKALPSRLLPYPKVRNFSGGQDCLPERRFPDPVLFFLFSRTTGKHACKQKAGCRTVPRLLLARMPPQSTDYFNFLRSSCGTAPRLTTMEMVL